MAESLDYVLQPDGSYKWELVELRAEKLYEAPPADLEPTPRRFGRKSKDTETES